MMTRMGCRGWMFYIWKVSDAGSRQSHNARPAPCLYCKWKEKKRKSRPQFLRQKIANIKYKCTKIYTKHFWLQQWKWALIHNSLSVLRSRHINTSIQIKEHECTKIQIHKYTNSQIWENFLPPTMTMGVVLWLMVGFAFQASEYKQKRISAQRYKFKYTNMKRKK